MIEIEFKKLITKKLKEEGKMHEGLYRSINWSTVTQSFYLGFFKKFLIKTIQSTLS